MWEKSDEEILNLKENTLKDQKPKTMAVYNQRIQAIRSREETKTQKVVLGYWNFRGVHRGSATRYLLAYSQASWEEKSYSMTSGEWPAAKEGLMMDFPNLPYITVGDFKLSETAAIHFYIAEKYCPSLLGLTLQEKARVIQLHKIGDENIMNGVKECFVEGSDKAAVTVKFMDGLAPLGNLLSDRRKFLTGASPSIADFVLFEHIEYANQLTRDLEEKTYTRYP